MKWRVYTAERGMLLDGEQASEIARAPGGERRAARGEKKEWARAGVGLLARFESGGAQADLVEAVSKPQRRSRVPRASAAPLPAGAPRSVPL